VPGATATTFGTATQDDREHRSELLNGFGIRPNDWQIGASVQQQLMPRMSVEFGYFWRWLGNFTATDNTAVAATDFNAYAITAPSDPRLPGGGGYSLATSLTLVPGKLGQNSNTSRMRRTSARSRRSTTAS